MKNEEHIHTLHPQGKNGVNILKRRYNIISDYIRKTLEHEGEISYQDLSGKAVRDLSDSFDGKVMWYVVTVKLDLEARKIIERVPNTSPHRIRLIAKRENK